MIWLYFFLAKLFMGWISRLNCYMYFFFFFFNAGWGGRVLANFFSTILQGIFKPPPPLCHTQKPHWLYLWLWLYLYLPSLFLQNKDFCYEYCLIKLEFMRKCMIFNKIFEFVHWTENFREIQSKSIIIYFIEFQKTSNFILIGHKWLNRNVLWHSFFSAFFICFIFC